MVKKSGVSKKPPPSPTNEATMPTARPRNESQSGCSPSQATSWAAPGTRDVKRWDRKATSMVKRSNNTAKTLRKSVAETFLATIVPNCAPTNPPRPIQKPSAYTTRWASASAMNPDRVMSRAMQIEVPAADMCSMPKKRNSGTMRNPPPMPASEAKAPMVRPMPRNAAAKAGRGRALRRSMGVAVMEHPWETGLNIRARIALSCLQNNRSRRGWPLSPVRA